MCLNPVALRSLHCCTSSLSGLLSPMKKELLLQLQSEIENVTDAWLSTALKSLLHIQSRSEQRTHFKTNKPLRQQIMGSEWQLFLNLTIIYKPNWMWYTIKWFYIQGISSSTVMKCFFSWNKSNFKVIESPKYWEDLVTADYCLTCCFRVCMLVPPTGGNVWTCWSPPLSWSQLWPKCCSTAWETSSPSRISTVPQK